MIKGKSLLGKKKTLYELKIIIIITNKCCIILNITYICIAKMKATYGIFDTISITAFVNKRELGGWSRMLPGLDSMKEMSSLAHRTWPRLSYHVDIWDQICHNWQEKLSNSNMPIRMIIYSCYMEIVIYTLKVNIKNKYYTDTYQIIIIIKRIKVLYFLLWYSFLISTF